jgi:hypothetical protein
LSIGAIPLLILVTQETWCVGKTGGICPEKNINKLKMTELTNHSNFYESIIPYDVRKATDALILMSPLLGHRLSLWITHKENGPFFFFGP